MMLRQELDYCSSKFKQLAVSLKSFVFGIFFSKSPVQKEKSARKTSFINIFLTKILCCL